MRKKKVANDKDDEKENRIEEYMAENRNYRVAKLAYYAEKRAYLAEKKEREKEEEAKHEKKEELERALLLTQLNIAMMKQKHMMESGLSENVNLYEVTFPSN